MFPDFETLVKTYEQIAKVGFPFVLFLLLVGHYFDIWRWGKTERARELETKAQYRELEERRKTEVSELKAHAAAREASQQHRIDQLFDKMIEAAGLIEKSARQSARGSR